MAGGAVHGRYLRRALAVALVAALIGACGTDRNGLPTEWRFENRTDGPLRIVWERASGEAIELATLAPGEKASVSVNQYGNPRYLCDEGEMAAVDRAGVEVDRWPTTCQPWVVPRAG